MCHMLDELYTLMDAVSSSYELYKIETIGDSYMAAGGERNKQKKRKFSDRKTSSY